MFPKLIRLLALLLLAGGCATRKAAMTPPVTSAITVTDSLLSSILAGRPTQFDSIIRKGADFQVRIIYTVIDRDSNNAPHFTDHELDLSTTGYFYPASTVKMPVALLSLQRLHELAIPGVDKNTSL